MDGTDRRIYQTWQIPLAKGGGTIEVRETDTTRAKVAVTSSSPAGAYLYLTVDDLSAVIRALTLARERLETLGAMDGLEKVAP